MDLKIKNLKYKQELLRQSHSKTNETYTHISTKNLGKIISPLGIINKEMRMRLFVSSDSFWLFSKNENVFTLCYYQSISCSIIAPRAIKNELVKTVALNRNIMNEININKKGL